MQLTFLGTCAGTPSLQRNVTSIALTLSHRGDCWLFDCGEATQHQFMRSALKPGKLQKSLSRTCTAIIFSACRDC